MWATRICCEAALYDENSFCTLTYDDEHNPGGLYKGDLQLFLKRFRERLAPTKIRYFACGEYGSENHRAHWHIIIFGWYPGVDDVYETGFRRFDSHLLRDCWGNGITDVGLVEPASAQYVAQYSVKKITGPLAEDFYVHPETGEICIPECALMSRRPGIGSRWFEQNLAEVFPSDSVLFNKKLVKPPKYFFEKLKLVNPLLAEEVARSRSGEFDEDEFVRLVLDGVAEKFDRSREAATDTRHKEL